MISSLPLGINRGKPKGRKEIQDEKYQYSL